MSSNHGAPARTQLDQALQRFVTAAIEGRDHDALMAYADADAFMPNPRHEHDDARAWVDTELAAAARLRPDIDQLDERRQLIAWGRARGRGGRR